MKRFAFAFVLAAVMSGSFAQAQSQTDRMVDRCGQLTQEMNLALEQRVALEKRREEIKDLPTTSLGDLRMIDADINHIDSMISEINQEMNNVCM